VYAGTQPSLVSPGVDDQLHQIHHLTTAQLNQTNGGHTGGSTSTSDGPMQLNHPLKPNWIIYYLCLVMIMIFTTNEFSQDIN